MDFPEREARTVVSKGDPTRAVLYSVAGGVLTAVFGVLGATDAHAEPRDTAGQPPAKEPSPKKAESPAGRLTGPTPARARQQAADIRKARESRPANEKDKKTPNETKTEKQEKKQGDKKGDEKKAESAESRAEKALRGRLTGPTPERARQQAADIRKARESRPANEKDKKTPNETKTEKQETPQRNVVRTIGHPSEQEKEQGDKKDDGKKAESPESRVEKALRGRLTGPTPERARQQAADIRKARQSRPANDRNKATKEDKGALDLRNLVDGTGRGAGGGAREILQDLMSAGSRPESTDRFPIDLSSPAPPSRGGPDDKKKEETLEERVARTSPSPERSRQQSADVRQARKDQSPAQKARGGAGEILQELTSAGSRPEPTDRFPLVLPGTDASKGDGSVGEKRSPAPARPPEHLREVFAGEPKPDSGDRFPGMVPNAVITERGGRPGAGGGPGQNHDNLLTAGSPRGQTDEFPGMAKNTPTRTGQAPVKDPDDHWIGNVADEARETIVESLESIPAAVGGFIQANQDATTWSEADPNSDEWRAADKRIKERGEAVAEVVRNPGKVVEEVIRPYKEDWNSDKPERVVGRAAVDIGTMFIPGVGVGKRVMNAAEALSGGRGPDLGTVARPRPDSEPGKGSTSGSPPPADLPARPDSGAGTPNPQISPDRAGTAPPAGTQGSKAGTTAPRTSSRSPDKDGQGRRVLPAPVTQLPTLPRGDSPTRRAADKPRQDNATPPSPKTGDAESKQRSSDRTPESDTKTSPEARGSADAATQCPTNSFVPGTLVLMADGSRKRIEDIKPGELVAARDPETGASGARPVAALITGSGQKELVEITVDIDGMAGDRTGVLVATDEHPFWIESERSWVEAEDLVPGLRVQTPEGRALAITETRLSTAQRTVHNLSVTDINTYYVLAGDEPVLVHNANRPCGVTSMINQDPLLVKAAESAGKNQRIQKEMDDLVRQFRDGNTNPGLGNKALEGTDIQYLRGRNGGRVFFRNTDEGMQIVGKADKTNESRVIKRLKELYGG